MKDYREIQRSNAYRDSRQLLERDVFSIDQFNAGCKTKRWPAGSVWFWALECVYGPKGSANIRSAAE